MQNGEGRTRGMSDQEETRMQRAIHVKGAREHNLKNVDLTIPRDALVVFTGVSGSGKTSLAFDTIYAEGYRKYMDSLSVKARQLLDQVKRPEVDYIEGLSPVIAIEQQSGHNTNPRSTVATVTEIADYARLLWSLAGTPHCPKDGGRIVQRSLDDCLERLLREPEGTRAMLLAPYMTAKPSVLRGEIPHLRQRGYQRLRVAGEIRHIDDDDVLPGGREPVTLEIVVDRLVLREDQRARLADSLELAFREGGNRAVALLERRGGDGDAQWEPVAVSQHHACETCGTVYDPVTPKHFSYNHPDGACPACGGLGETLQFAPELLVPDPSKSVKSGAVKPWRLGSKRMIIQRNAILKQLAEQMPFDPKTPWSELPEETRHAILHGTGHREFLFKLKPGNSKPEAARFEGVIADLENTRRETSSDGLRARLMAYQVSSRCATCGGRKLRSESRAVTLDGTNFTEFMALDLRAAAAFLDKLRSEPPEPEGMTGRRLEQMREVISGLGQRLRFLNEVGLHYLSLDRPFHTLSGGESQRVRLATQLGMGLVGVGYVLDEPTIGLHPYDTRRLVSMLEELRDRGNAVIVVEHDAEVIRAADHLVEIGPGAGVSGGRVMYQGDLEGAMQPRASLTGAYLSGVRTVEREADRRAPAGTTAETGSGWLSVVEATENNLRGITAEFPVGLLTCVTGVSGSGKSTLVNDILARAAAFKLNRAKSIPGRHRRIDGLEQFERVVLVDQDPIGRSPRSNPATYTKIFDELRKLYAKTPLAKVRGYSPSRFSFNVRGGRCERCQGDGVIRLDMQFLSDVYAECPSCEGQRYNRETLEIRFKGISIAEALDLSVDEAAEVFGNHPKIITKLETLQAVGLGYLSLGQAANTLSGGEAQRLKLSLELSKRQTGRNLYILDEPTTGLHWADIQHLVDLLFRLRDQGNTIILIEHDLDVIRLADWVIDLGPGGGDEGGRIIYSGPPDAIASEPESRTGQVMGSR